MLLLWVLFVLPVTFDPWFEECPCQRAYDRDPFRYPRLSDQSMNTFDVLVFSLVFDVFLFLWMGA